MVELTKKTKKQLRELMLKAYAKELDELLVALSKKFDAWKNHQIDCWFDFRIFRYSLRQY
jgi:hypothetical protein